MWFIKTLLVIAGFVGLLFVGAEAERMFPGKPVTEIWMVSIVLAVFIFGLRWAFKADRRRALSHLASTGYYAEETLNQMSTVELTTREQRHKKDSSQDWSNYTFGELVKLEAAEKAEKAARAAAVEARSEAAETPRGKIVCINCGLRMSKFITWNSSQACISAGRRCVPYETPRS
jgi:hypothetical protein